MKLEMEKSEPWIPAGMPIFIIFRNTWPEKRSSLRRISCERRRQRTVRKPDTHRLSTVARATPATSMPTTITKKRFIITFSTPATAR